MSISDLLQWWNLIYAAPLLVSLVWIVATVMSGAYGDVSHGGDGGADVDGAGSDGFDGQDVGDGDADFGQDQGDGGDGEVHGHDDGIYSKILWILGVRQVPVTLVFGIFLLCWGAFGLAANRLLAGIMTYPALYVLPSVGITFVTSALVTRLTASLMARYMPGTETYGVTRFDMIGSLGGTVYKVTETSGTVNIRDSYGTVHREQCKTEPGGEPIPANTEVIVVDYDEVDKRFIVRISDF